MYCIVECRLGVAINPKHKIKDHKIFYVIDKREIIEEVEQYFAAVPRLNSTTGFEYVKKRLIKGKVSLNYRNACLVANKFNNAL